MPIAGCHVLSCSLFNAVPRGRKRRTCSFTPVTFVTPCLAVPPCRRDGRRPHGAQPHAHRPRDRRAQPRRRDARAHRHPRAWRAARRTAGARDQAAIAGVDVPTGALDITLYRDDLRASRRRAAAGHPPHRRAVLHRRPADPARRRRAVHGPDDSRGASTRSSTSAGRARFSSWRSSTAATASCPFAPTTSAATSRRRAQQSVQVRLVEIDGRDEVEVEG